MKNTLQMLRYVIFWLHAGRLSVDVSAAHVHRVELLLFALHRWHRRQERTVDMVLDDEFPGELPELGDPTEGAQAQLSLGRAVVVVGFGKAGVFKRRGGTREIFQVSWVTNY